MEASMNQVRRELTIAAVNPHKDKTISTDILLQEGNFDGNFKVYEVNGPDVKAENDFNSEKVVTKESLIVFLPFVYSFKRENKVTALNKATL
jgi:alpha-L-arabinofuranosidase